MEKRICAQTVHIKQHVYSVVNHKYVTIATTYIMSIVCLNKTVLQVCVYKVVPCKPPE